MKKRIIALFMILVMMATMLAGCGQEAPAEEASEATEDVYMEIDAYSYALGFIRYTETDMDGESVESETMTLAMNAVAGQTIAEVWEANGYEFSEVYAEGEVFEGWMVYKMINETDEEGFDISRTYERISGDDLYTTEEFMELEVPGHDVVYCAKWENYSMDAYDSYFSDLASMIGDEVVDTAETFIALDANDGMMTFAAAEPYETDFTLYYFGEGTSVDEAMNEWSEPLEAIAKDGAEFAGWTIYEGDFAEWPEEVPANLPEGSICFEINDYTNLILDNCTVYSENASMDELKALVCEGKTYFAIANWE